MAGTAPGTTTEDFYRKASGMHGKGGAKLGLSYGEQINGEQINRNQPRLFCLCKIL